MATAKHISEDMLPALRAAGFWEAVSRGLGCWAWTGATNEKGYGRFSFNGETHRAHRIAFALGKNTALPGVVMVCHRCDNPVCCNPEHLFLGLAVDNNEDAASKGRAPRATGMRNARAKLTDEAIQHIRNSNARNADLSALYGVSDGHISRIRSGERRSA